MPRPNSRTTPLNSVRMRKFVLSLAIGIPLLCLAGIAAYSLPPIHDKLAWRIEELRAKVQYTLNPPEQVVFVPQKQVDANLAAIVQATLTARPVETRPAAATPTPTLAPVGPSATPPPPPSPTSTPPPLPGSFRLGGITHEYQLWNNCGPATLAMDLSFWGWQGDQKDTAAFLKPNTRDKNVMPYEMENYVTQMTGLKILVRYGGDLQTIKAFVAAGFPTIVEKGFEGATFDGWMGHYEVVNGYDDAKSRFTAQDSYLGPNLSVPYDQMESYWRAFDFVYLIVYPAQRENEVLSILGPQADATANLKFAADKASAEISQLTGRDLYFAWYNRGTSLELAQDYTGAAAAYDQAFALYPSIPEKSRPWRMLWYQTGPYFSYYHTGRYADVIDLATKTLDASNEPVLEESFYWRGMAKNALGDTKGAIEDFQASIQAHPGFGPALVQLQQLGNAP